MSEYYRRGREFDSRQFELGNFPNWVKKYRREDYASKQYRA